MSALDFENVSVTFGHGARRFTAVDEVSIGVAEGEILGLVGESGSGKSTLARAAVGLCEPSGGRILKGGTEVSHARGAAVTERRRIHLIFQDPSSCLDPRRTIGASLDEALTAAARRDGAESGSGRSRRAGLGSLLESVKLPASAADLYPAQLSGGQRQRGAIARAVASRPDVILADEITSALDVSVQGAVINQLLELQRAQGFSMIFISHNLAVVRLVCDRVAVLKAGRLVESGPVESVLGAPREDYTRQLIAAVPALPTIPAGVAGGHTSGAASSTDSSAEGSR